MNTHDHLNALPQVIVSVGGDPSSGGNWDKLNPQSIANFCNDFGLDGVDLDFETTPTGCPGACSTDASYINAIQKMRAFLAPHLLITTAPASVGSYGEASSHIYTCLTNQITNGGPDTSTSTLHHKEFFNQPLKFVSPVWDTMSAIREMSGSLCS